MALVNTAVLSHKQIVECRQEAMIDILLAWQPMQGASSYTLQCPCRNDCDCSNMFDKPRILLQECLYGGVLDFFIVVQPFLELGFYVSWYCNTCEEEMACGMPT